MIFKKNNNNRFVILALGFICFAVLGAHTLDIPLSGGGGEGTGQKIGYVDMERIFQVYPETKYAREDYNKRLVKKRELISAKEKELEEIRNQISVLEATFKQLEGDAGPTASSTDSTPSQQAVNEPAALEELKSQLEQNIQNLEEEKKQAKVELQNFEKKQSQIILGKIYQALKDLALEEQVNLVVDKSSILFGAAEIDLTDKLTEKVRGY